MNISWLVSNEEQESQDYSFIIIVLGLAHISNYRSNIVNILVGDLKYHSVASNTAFKKYSGKWKKK